KGIYGRQIGLHRGTVQLGGRKQWREEAGLPQQLPQYVLQDSTVLIILKLVWSIDACDGLECFFFAVLATRANRSRHSGLKFPGNALDIESFEACQSQHSGVVAFHKLQGQNSHPHEVTSMYALEALRQDGLHSQKARTFGRPIAR